MKYPQGDNIYGLSNNIPNFHKSYYDTFRYYIDMFKSIVNILGGLMVDVLLLALWLIAFVLNTFLIVTSFHYIRILTMFGIIFCIVLSIIKIIRR